MIESREIENFLKTYGERISCNEYNFLYNARLRAQQLEQELILNSIFGYHFQSCPSSDNSSSQGWNACTCFLTSFILYQAVNIMKIYK